MRPFKQAISIVAGNRRSYIVTNVLFYGLIICGMIVAAINPGIQQMLTAAIGSQFKHSFPRLIHFYESGNIPAASALTFVINSVFGTFVSITLPSLLIPFSGFIVATLRPFVWGIAMAPTTPKMLHVMIPHSLTLLMEGQAYVLAAFGSYLSGKWFLFPRTAGLETHWQGFVAGIRANLILYPLILTILAVSAVYEATEVTMMQSVFNH